MHRIASLEGNDAAPSQTGELGAQLRWSETESAEIIVRRNLHAFDASTDVPRIGLVHRVVRARMGFAGAVKNRLSLGRAVGLPDFFDVEHGEHDAFEIAQSNLAGARR